MFAGRSIKHRLPSLTRTYREVYRKGLLESSKMGYLARLVLTFTLSLSPCGPGWGKPALNLLKAQLSTA